MKTTYKINTKKELENYGWSFITLDGGRIVANHKKYNTQFSALTMVTLRKKISFFLS